MHVHRVSSGSLESWVYSVFVERVFHQNATQVALSQSHKEHHSYKKICCPMFYTDKNNLRSKVSKICFQIQHMSVQDFRSQTIMEYTLQNTTLEAHKKREVEVLPLWFLDGLVFHFLFTFFNHGAQNNLRHIRKRDT